MKDKFEMLCRYNSGKISFLEIVLNIISSLKEYLLSKIPIISNVLFSNVSNSPSFRYKTKLYGNFAELIPQKSIS